VGATAARNPGHRAQYHDQYRETLAERLRVEIQAASLLSPDIQTIPAESDGEYRRRLLRSEMRGSRDLINRADEGALRAKGGGGTASWSTSRTSVNH